VTTMPTSTPTHATTGLEVILGVDTHKDVHLAAVVDSLGQVLDTEAFPATNAGYQQLSSWARSRGI
jgi:transposase